MNSSRVGLFFVVFLQHPFMSFKKIIVYQKDLNELKKKKIINKLLGVFNCENLVKNI